METTRICVDCDGFEPPCCECHRLDHCCHACYLSSPKKNNEHQVNTIFEVAEDANIANPPEEVTWYPAVYWDYDASWNLRLGLYSVGSIPTK